VARQDHGVVAEPVEQLRRHVAQQGRELLRGVGLADPAGEEAVPGEEGGGPVGGPVGEGDASGGVPHEADDLQGRAADRDGVAVPEAGELQAGRGGDRRGVRDAGDQPGAGRPGDLG